MQITLPPTTRLIDIASLYHAQGLRLAAKPSHGLIKSNTKTKKAGNKS